MAGDEFRAGLDELLALAAHERPAIMCSEAVPWRCHRRLISDSLLVEGVEVLDILSRTSVRPAVLTEHAQVEDGVLTYPARGTDRVREAVAAIPAGRVATYGDVGDRVGTTARQVGRIMSELDDDVPWWRVVHADGSPATCHGGQAVELLRDEGTPMRRTRVDLERARLR